MVTYPISVPRKFYKGSKSNIRNKISEYNRIASELEDLINSKINSKIEKYKKDTSSQSDYYQILYYQIAAETNYDIDLITEILFGVDCGHNGFTVRL